MSSFSISMEISAKYKINIDNFLNDRAPIFLYSYFLLVALYGLLGNNNDLSGFKISIKH